MKCLITIKSENPSSYMFHTPNIDLVEYQSKALELPIVIGKSKGEKEKELLDLRKIINEAKEQYNLDGIITGALFSNYQRQRIENICKELDLSCFSPLWHTDQEELLHSLIEEKFEIIITAVAGDGLSEEDLGKQVNDNFIEKMIKLNKKNRINIAGEGGEFESLVINCPIFNKEIKILESEKVMENEFTGKLIIKKTKLVDKK